VPSRLEQSRSPYTLDPVLQMATDNTCCMLHIACSYNVDRLVQVMLQTSESAARSEGLREIQKSIDVMEEQMVGLRADLSAIRDIKEREMDNGSKELQRMVPLAVLQVAQVQHGLCDDAAKHWECLARRLGADMAGV
jgi:hypothetical protein